MIDPGGNLQAAAEIAGILGFLIVLTGLFATYVIKPWVEKLFGAQTADIKEDLDELKDNHTALAAEVAEVKRTLDDHVHDENETIGRLDQAVRQMRELYGELKR